MSLSSNLHPWTSCTRCGLHRYRRNVVLGRGTIPAPYLFIGEAPGPTEDLRASAFIGRAGRLLSKAIAMAARMAGLSGIPRYYITNVVGCIPHDSIHAKFRAPRPVEIIACRPRLTDTFRAVAPEHVILLGKVAEKECKILCPDGLALRHPSYIARTGGVEGPEFPKFVLGLSELFAGTCQKEWIVKRRVVLA